MKAFVVFLILLFIAGGFKAVALGIDGVCQVFVQIFPVIAPAFVQSFEEYLTSTRFVVGVILIIASSLGIYLTAREKKALYCIVSIIIDVISFVSVITNLVKCV